MAQGEDFADGVIIAYSGGMFFTGADYLHVNDFKSGQKLTPHITRGMFTRKYHLVHTQPEAMRKV